MEVKTTIDIPFSDWMAQYTRFGNEDYKLIYSMIPLNTPNSSNAIIRLNIETLDYPRFSAKVNYIQTITTQKLVTTFDEQGNEDGTAVIDDVSERLILTYSMVKSYDEIHAIMDAIDPFIPENITGLARVNAQILEGMLQDILAHNTFATAEHPNGLPRELYVKK